MSKVTLKYTVALPDSRERTFDLEMDRETAVLAPPTDDNPPPWTGPS